MLSGYVWRWRLAAIALAAVMVQAPLADGAQAKRRRSREDELEERVRRLEELLRERQTEPPKPAAAAPAQPPDRQQVEQIVDDQLKKQKMLAGWQDGFFLQSPSGDFKLKLRGYVQADARFFPFENGDTGTDSFFLRRLRPIFEGTVYKYFDFKLMPDFGEGKQQLQDGYLNINYWKEAQLQAGKYKAPVSLERLQSATDLIFIERSIANNLLPNREVGVDLHGDLFDGVLTYAGGLFNGSFDGGSNDGDVTSDKDFHGRLFAEPFHTSAWAPLKGLGLGVGGTWGQQKREDLKSLAFKTAGRSTFFKYDSTKDIAVLADGHRTRIAPQGYYFWGRFGLMGEYVLSTQDLLRTENIKQGKKTVTKLTDGSVDNRGWFVQASYVLTGENASYKGVVPINPFDPRLGRWGAFELAGRVSQVDIDDAAFASKVAQRPDSASAIAYTGGINWYFNKNFKFQLNYERTDFDTPIKFDPKHQRDHEDVVITRFQVAF